jgi:cation:H+ antiporter
VGSLTNFLLLLLGLATLLAGARWFVGGISAIAKALGVPPLVIGMTVVAFGTSTPELVINAVSATKGSTGLAFGNIVGSCVVNIGFVLALTAMIKPLRVEPSLITREIPMLIVSVGAFGVLGADHFLGDADSGRWVRADGIVLLLFFCIFLYYTTREALSAKADDAFMEEVRAENKRAPRRQLIREVFLASAGLVGVTVGAEWTVNYAVEIARLWGMSEALIGLTIISLGTTLPELATCVMAARRGDSDIALGNIVGSNIFNLLCIGGIVTTIEPMPLPSGGIADLAVMTLLTAILLPVAIRSQRTITRGEGAFLFSVFAGYLAWRLLPQS